MRLLASLALALASPAAAQDAPEPVTPASVVAAAPASDWRAIDPADLLVMDLAPDRDGKPRRVVIQLLPPPFSQGWVENVRTLAKAHWWDGTSVYRVVDNWVTQWGDADETKPLPEGLRVVPESEYTITVSPEDRQAEFTALMKRVLEAHDQGMTVGFISNPWFDSYADEVGFSSGWPIASERDTTWPVHCYASVGVARDTETTGTGSELYAVIGHAPRQLDRNIAVVGRVIEGIEHLSTLPRGKGEAGVYDDPALRVPIVSVRLGNEVPEVPQPLFEYLASDSASFAEYVRVRANRNDAFYQVPAGGIDVCNVQVPIRRVPSE
jgi:peptidylprolyl isomerase